MAVPSDVHEDAEVLVVLGALGPTVAQAQAIREQAQQGARTLLEEAARQVQAILARAWAPQPGSTETVWCRAGS